MEEEKKPYVHPEKHWKQQLKENIYDAILILLTIAFWIITAMYSY
jgi:hypothetical protein